MLVDACTATCMSGVDECLLMSARLSITCGTTVIRTHVIKIMMFKYHNQQQTAHRIGFDG